MAGRLIFLFLIALPSVYGLGWSQFFTRWIPLRPLACPAQDHSTHEIYKLVQTPVSHCTSSLDNRCPGARATGTPLKRTRIILSTISVKGPCNAVNTTTCTSYECKRSCISGYHRDENGRCVSTATLHCFNGGELVNNTCMCSANFTGKQCDIPVCSPACRNGGVCSIPPNSRCYCPPYLTGSVCETPVCSDRCTNGGECVLTGHGSVCICRPGFTGSRCEWTQNLPVCDADAVISTAKYECLSDQHCEENKYCCGTTSSSYWGHCALRPNTNKVTCTHDDGGVAVADDIYNSARDCETCVCYRPTNTSSDQGHFRCITAECTGDFLYNSKCCPTIEHRPCPPPIIDGCPRKGEIIPVYTSSHDNHALITNTFVGHDCLGNKMYVTLSRMDFKDCTCDIPQKYDVTATTIEKDLNGRRGKCDFQVVVKDTTKPMFHSCPPNIYARHGEKVSWKKPLVTDNVGVKVVFFLSPGISNNSVPTTPGIHFLQYAASDWQGNKAYCNFRIQVYKTDSGDTNYPPELKARETHSSGVVIAGAVVGVLCLTMIVLLIATVRFCKVRNNRQRHCRSRRHQDQRSESASGVVPSDIFSIYSTDPPPYEVAAKHKLPEYSPSDNPPKYEDTIGAHAYANPAYASEEQNPASSTDSSSKGTNSSRVTDV